MYFVIAVFLFLLGILEIIYPKFKFLFLRISILLYFCIIGFNRWSPDYENYIRIFEKAEIYLKYKSYEIGFLKLIDILKKISINFYGFQIILSLIIIISLYKLLKNKSRYPVCCLSLYYLIPLYPNIVQLRQFLAFSFLYLALSLNLNSRMKGLYTIVTIFFHKSMFLILPIFYLKKKKIFKNTKKYLFIVNLIFIFFIFLNIFNVEKIVYLTLKFFGLTRYMESSLNQKTLIGDLFLIFPFFILSNIYFIFYSDLDKNDLEIVNYQKYIFIVFIFLLFYRDIIRFVYNIFFFYVIFYLNNLFYKKSKLKKIYIFLCCYIVMIIIYYYQFLYINNGGYLEIISKTITTNGIFMLF